jgi:hypothetical protein
MGKFLMYLYLMIAFYCIANVFYSVHTQSYQLTILMAFLSFINLVLFGLFRKEAKRRQIRSLQF